MKNPLVPLLFLVATVPVASAQMASSNTLSPQTQRMLSHLARREYPQARQAMEAIEPIEVIRVLLPAASRNNTHAQWMVAIAYWKTGDKSKSGAWAYTARMGTMLDATSCADFAARNADAILIAPYYSLLREVRRDPVIEQNSVRFAAQHYANTWRQYQDPAWTCRAYQAWTGKSSHGMTAGEDQWAWQRRVLMETLLRRSGLSDLIPKNKSTSNDPLQQDFGLDSDFGSPLSNSPSH